MSQPHITRMRLQDALAQGILQADPANANKGTERGEYMITQSLQRTGVGRGIVVDQKGYIVAGNKTAQAAAELSDDVEVIIIETDGKQLVVTRRTDFDLTDPSPTNVARQAAYSDNRASEVSLQWDFEQIGQDLLAGVDLSDWFHDDEIQATLDDLSLSATPPSMPTPKLNTMDDEQTVQCPSCGHEFAYEGPSGIRRPLLRYAGSKFLAYQRGVAPYMPKHSTYIEPFGGGAAVLLRKPPSAIEIYNDIDGEMVNFFCVLQDETQFKSLQHRLTYTSYSESEFLRAYEPQATAVERAWAVFVKAWMGYRTNAIHDSTAEGFKKTSIKGAYLSSEHDNRTRYANEFASQVDALSMYAERLRRVEIRNQDALELIKKYRDSDRVLFYLDPPYPQDVLQSEFYTHDMNNEQQHREFAALLNGAQAMILLHGYRSPLYDDLFADWQCIDHYAHTQANTTRTESLWINPAAWAALQHSGPWIEDPLDEDPLDEYE